MTNLRSKTFEGRLKELVERRKRCDMITMFRIMTGKDKVDPEVGQHLQGRILAG
jgi:hypothetical protein